MFGPPEFSATEIGAAMLGLGLFYQISNRTERAAGDMILSGAGFLIYALISYVI